MKTISASDANRHFSHLLRDVGAGEVFIVVSRGRPVATIAPVQSGSHERQVAKNHLLERLRQQVANRAASGTRDWTRETLYED